MDGLPNIKHHYYRVVSAAAARNTGRVLSNCSLDTISTTTAAATSTTVAAAALLLLWQLSHLAGVVHNN